MKGAPPPGPARHHRGTDGSKPAFRGQPTRQTDCEAIPGAAPLSTLPPRGLLHRTGLGGPVLASDPQDVTVTRLHAQQG